jgi:ADP-heptose:LPS heptosyltransferase
MINKKYLIFRTDRVGDFLFSLKLIKIIKTNDPQSEITIIASKKNYKYIQTFNVVDKIILFKNDLLSKIKLIFLLRRNKYETIIIHDGKNRSKFISFFLKFKKKAICITNLIDNQIEIIQKTCKKVGLKFDIGCLDFMDNRKHSLKNLPFENYIHFHFDEKWIHEDYIQKYINIEPNKEELIFFINSIVEKNKNLIITTGKNISNLLNEIKSEINSNKVKIFDNQDLLEIENIVFKSILLISCHGWITHIASAKKIKQIDIIDDSYPYNKWTSHLRNYNSLSRKDFKILSREIINLI